jgi:hypothetical protein
VVRDPVATSAPRVLRLCLPQYVYTAVLNLQRRVTKKGDLQFDERSCMIGSRPR